MSGKEYTAKSIEEALEKALNEMMLTREDIEYEVLVQPSKGILGFGKKDAVVRVKKKVIEDFEIDIEDSFMEEEVIVKRKSIELKPIDEEEAILQMELLGHNFFVYKDMHTNDICVVYKRKDGNYGIIDTNN